MAEAKNKQHMHAAKPECLLVTRFGGRGVAGTAYVFGVTQVQRFEGRMIRREIHGPEILGRRSRGILDSNTMQYELTSLELMDMALHAHIS